jgi:hypothetical protein
VQQLMDNAGLTQERTLRRSNAAVQWLRSRQLRVLDPEGVGADMVYICGICGA